MQKAYKTFAKVSSPCLFDYQTRKEALEACGSPLAKLIDTFNFEKYHSDIVACVKRETAKKKLASERLPKKTLNPLLSKLKCGMETVVLRGRGLLWAQFGTV